MSLPQRLLARLLRATRIEWLPVRVRSGIAGGAWWTLFPYSAYWRGTQEPAVHEAIIGLGDLHGWACWDLGAHFGVYAIGLARRVGPSGEVAAFEPNPVSYARLQHHHRLNHLAWLKTYCLAASDQVGVAELYTYGDLHTTTTHLRYDDEKPGAAAQPLQIRSIKLDDLVLRGELRRPQFIKVDVEGHGHHALSGARETLALARPILLIEFHCREEADGISALLDPLSYDWTGVTGTGEDWIGRTLLFKPRS